MISMSELAYDPSKPEAWNVNRHLQFYNCLKNHIAQQVKVYLPSLPIDAIEECLSDIVCSKDKDDDLLVNDDCYLEDWLGIDSGLYDSVVKVRNALEEQEILLEKITFPPQIIGSDPDYNKLFEPLARLIFKDCHFYCNNLTFTYPQHSLAFQGCVFHEHLIPDFNCRFALEDALFKSCIFKEGVSLNYIPFEGHAVFAGCQIAIIKIRNYVISSVIFRNLECCTPNEVAELYIYNSTLENDFILNLTKISKVQVFDSVFSGKVNFSDCVIEDLQIKDVVFEKTCDLSASVITRINFTGVEFKDFALFEQSVFGADNPLLIVNQQAVFERVTFHKAANFRDVIFYLPFDLRNTTFLQTPTFLGSIFKDQAKMKTDRETFRIIKQSFFAVNNQIEADRIYALEMEAYRNELKLSKGSFWEQLLLSFNACISNHGQSYTRAGFWFFSCIGFIAFVLANDQPENQWIPTYLPMPDCWLSMTQFLNGFALGFLPFAKLYEGREHLAFFVMIATFALSGITWQLLVALRRHSRR